jgi:Polyketide cyclase / dehydrase and lipid transport
LSASWTFEHSVDCAVPVPFAWAFWTNVRNWALDADVESIEIDGPFSVGARGVTHSRSSGRIEWRISEVETNRAVIEFPVPGATGRFAWTFHPASSSVTRITQNCTLHGPEAANIARAVAPGLEAGIPEGMKKLSRTIEDHYLGSIR